MQVDSVKQVIIEYHTSNLPPPYQHKYKLRCKILKDLELHFELTYLNRDTLTEDEILEEGFSLHDDFQWSGSLPEVWSVSLQEEISQTTFENKEKDLMITVDQGEKKGPHDTSRWEYFLQEMIQGIYEVSQKEDALRIKILKVGQSKSSAEIVFVFRMREIKINPLKQVTDFSISWEMGRSLLKDIYSLEYFYDESLRKEPSNTGYYIDLGDGMWYQLGKAAQNPHPDNKATERIIAYFDKYFTD